MSRQSRLAYELIPLLNEPENIKKILNISHKYIGNPIHLTDLSGKLLAASDHDLPVDDIWEGIERRGYIDYETYQVICQANVRKIRTHNAPVLIPDAPGGVVILACGVQTPKHFHANLIVIENARPITKEDEKLLSLTAAGLSAILDQCFPDGGRKIHPVDYLICDLLEQPDMPIDAITQRCMITCFAPASPLQILTVCNSKNITSVPVLNMTRGHLEKIFPGCTTVIHNNRTVTILSGLRLDKESFAACGILPFLEKYGLTASLSRPFSQLKETHAHYMQTVYALEYGSILEPESLFYNYEDYTLCRFLDDTSGRHIIHPAILRLQEYDSRHQTDYTRTLYAYIINMRSMKDAAAYIHVHYNTMKYRLNRIFEQIDIDTRDTGTFIMLYLSFKAMELSGTAIKGETDL